MKSFRYIAYSLLVMGVLTIISCSRMDDYNDFIGGKEIVYPGKVDSIKVHSGKNRIGLTWLLISDPKITRAVVYWNNMADSVEIPIIRTTGVDSISVTIPNLAIGVYNFIIFTYDKDNHRSVPVNVSGRVFGEDYEKHLSNRSILSANRLNVTGGPLIITWSNADTTAADAKPIGVKVTYKDNSGKSLSKIVSNKDSTTVVTGFSLSEPVQFSTMFKPSAIALDTFYAPKEQIKYKNIGVVSITGLGDSPAKLVVENVVINKVDKLFTKKFVISRAGLDLKEGFGADLQVTTNDLPVGTDAITPGDVKLTLFNSTASISHIDVASGKDNLELSFTIFKTTLDANPGKLLAFNIILTDLKTSKFQVNGAVALMTVIIDVDKFKQAPEDFTSTYILNPGGTTPFQRADVGTGQFGTIKDWKINVYVQNNNPTLGKRGFSTNNEASAGYMYAARLSGDAKPTEGKIYQNIALPAGKYIFEMDFKEIAFRSEVVNNALYLAVTDKDTLPATGLNNQTTFPGNVSSCIAYTKMNYETFSPPAGGNNTNYNYNYTATMTFTLAAPTTVALGVIISYQNTNPYFLCRGVKLKKYVGAFD